MRAYVAQGINYNDPVSNFAFTTMHPVPEHPPIDTSVLVKIAYASVNPADIQYVNGVYEHAPAHPMPRFPCPLGVDGAGVVVAVGSEVSKFKIGDHVLGLHQRMDEGTWAEIASFEEHELAIKLENVCWQLAAAVPVAGVTALSALLCCPALQAAYDQHASISTTTSSSGDNKSSSGTDAVTPSAEAGTALPTAAPYASPGSPSATPAAVAPLAAAGTANAAAAEGASAQAASSSQVQSVLILGASGGVGSFAVMLAKHYFGIPLVLATCSGRNADYVRGLGADVVIDYTQQDVATAAQQALQQQQQQQQQASSTAPDGPPSASTTSSSGCSSSSKLDLVIDNVGGAAHMTLALGLLNPSNGLYVTSVPLSDPSSSSFGSVLSFFTRLGWRKALHALAPGRFPAVAFNGASPDGDKVQRLVDWLAAAEDVAHGRSAGSCLLCLTEFDLQDTGQALAAMQSKRVVGKLVLRVHGAL